MNYPNLNDALCKGIGLEFYYPEDESSGTSEEMRMAKKLCGSCPVLDACKEWGLRHEMYGVWGGLSPLDRRKERRRRGIILDQIIGTDYL
jgi:WhiB family redox-sensing transcriptional regulator